MNLNAYYEFLIHELTENLTANERLKKITTNPAILGAYAESSVRAFIQKIVAPHRISTGTIISPKMLSESQNLRQIDLIIWTPLPLPAIFESGEFAVVPYQSCLGFLEIKRSNYTGACASIASLLARADEFVKGTPGALTNRVTRSGKAQNGKEYSISGKIEIQKVDHGKKGMGVICLRDHHHTDKDLDALVEKEDVSVLLDRLDSGQIKPNPAGVIRLVNFLADVRKRGRDADGGRRISWDYVQKH